MSTTDGLEKLTKARKHIECFIDRRAFLVLKAEERVAAGFGTEWQDREIRAIDWALPALEAAWDDLARLHRYIDPVDNRLNRLRHKPDVDDKKPVAPLEPAPPPEVTDEIIALREVVAFADSVLAALTAPIDCFAAMTDDRHGTVIARAVNRSRPTEMTDDEREELR